ncbi:MAG: hypothetical protein ACD_58C00092G0013 [uncultured bacterium]|nr:MAG: hypothetical protein ACD_58C00092G0013 [uncultured bacterium]
MNGHETSPEMMEAAKAELKAFKEKFDQMYGVGTFEQLSKPENDPNDSKEKEMIFDVKGSLSSSEMGLSVSLSAKVDSEGNVIKVNDDIKNVLTGADENIVKKAFKKFTDAGVNYTYDFNEEEYGGEFYISMEDLNKAIKNKSIIIKRDNEGDFSIE